MTDVNPVLYILMRNDLPSMNAGKAMAQASHASNAFAHAVKDYSVANGHEEVAALYSTWRDSTIQGFGTVLVLAVNEREMRWAVSTAHLFGLVTDVIHDPTYPILIPPELGKAMAEEGDPAHAFFVGEKYNYTTIPLDTCAYVFGDKDDPMLKVAVGQFPLHP